MPRLLLDTRMLRGPLHGIARYSYCIAVEVARLRPQWQIGLWTLQPDVWKEAVAQFPNLIPWQVEGSPFSLKEQWSLPLSARKFRPDLVHFCSIAVPFWLPQPAVISLHDLTPFHFPSTPLHRPFIRHILAPVLRRARRIVCGSHHASQDMQRWLHIPAEKIRVLPYGGLDGPATPHSPAGGDIAQYLGRPYFLCVTNPKPHKNLTALLEAFRSLERDYDLLIVSGTAPWLEEALKNRPAVRRLHGVSDAELRGLYRSCLGIVIPSLYEGFGIPPLEAMQLEVPVISSNATSLPEVVGEAGLLFNPEQPQEMVSAMKRLAEDPDLRRDLVARGRVQAQKFSWERCAVQHISVYEEILGSGQ